VPGHVGFDVAQPFVVMLKRSGVGAVQLAMVA
jgi:hypothetical protein